MGSGKSTVGQELANMYGWLQIDSDQEIEKEQKLEIKEIFQQYGEEYFRDLETKLLQDISSKYSFSNQVVLLTTGGGLPLREKNRQILKGLGPTIFLYVSFGEIVKRLETDIDRPLWRKDELDEMENRYISRIPIYKEADILLQTDGKSIEEIANEIVRKVEEYNTGNI